MSDHKPVAQWQRWVVYLALLAVAGLLVISGHELLRTYFDPQSLQGLIGGEGPAAERCAYRTLHSYRVFNGLFLALCFGTVAALLPATAARKRLWLLVPLIGLVASFGFWYDWVCRAVSS